MGVLRWREPALFAIAAGSGWVLSRFYELEELTRFDSATYLSLARKLLNGEVDWLMRSPDGSVAGNDIAYPHLLRWVSEVAGYGLPQFQALNALLHGLSACVFFLILKKMRSGRVGSAWVWSLPLALSPMLSSFSGKIYSEPLAIFAVLLAFLGLIGFWTQPLTLGWRSFLASLAIVSGLGLLVLTKSAFFPLLVALSFLPALVLRTRASCVFSGLVAVLVIAISPIHKVVQQGGRGVIQVACQTAKMELWSYEEIAQCGIYNLSHSLGSVMFPELQGACHIAMATPDMGSFNRSYINKAYGWMREGFTYADGVKRIQADPLKYLWVSFWELPTALWIDGYYAGLTRDLPGWIRVLLYGLKLLLSTALWVCTALFLRRSLKRGGGSGNRVLAWSVLIFVGYTLAVHANVPVEQRHFMILLPALYLASACYWLRRQDGP